MDVVIVVVAVIVFEWWTYHTNKKHIKELVKRTNQRG